MNAQNFTQKTLEMIQTAKSMAMENNNQYITPEHLLYALVDQDGGLIPSLLGKMGVDCNAVLSELDTAIEGMPKVSGDYDIYLSREAERVMNAAEKSAKSLGDEYLSVEHVMIGIFASPTPAIKRIFDGHGIIKAKFTEELSKVKKGPVTGDNPENSYDALKKYGTDLVERARSNKLDPFFRVRRRITLCSSANPVSAKPLLQRDLLSVSSAATCRRDLKTKRYSRSTWARL